MQAKDIRPGNVILFSGAPHRVLDAQHRTPGNLRAFVQAKLRNLTSGLSTETRFSSTETVERVVLEQHEMQYLYADGDRYHFMNLESYEQVELGRDELGDAVQYLVADCMIKVETHEGRAIGVELPQTVELAVVETSPELRGATASNSPKPAKLETGLTVNVPPFVKEGDRVRVDTTTGAYLERVR